jgi:hypothetical protein
MLAKQQQKEKNEGHSQRKWYQKHYLIGRAITTQVHEEHNHPSTLDHR